MYDMNYTKGHVPAIHSMAHESTALMHTVLGQLPAVSVLLFFVVYNNDNHIIIILLI